MLLYIPRWRAECYGMIILRHTRLATMYTYEIKLYIFADGGGMRNFQGLPPRPSVIRQDDYQGQHWPSLAAGAAIPAVRGGQGERAFIRDGDVRKLKSSHCSHRNDRHVHVHSIDLPRERRPLRRALAPIRGPGQTRAQIPPKLSLGAVS